MAGRRGAERCGEMPVSGSAAIGWAGSAFRVSPGMVYGRRRAHALSESWPPDGNLSGALLSWMFEHRSDQTSPPTKRGSAARISLGGREGRYLRAKDVTTVATLPLAALLAWTMPERWWIHVAAAHTTITHRWSCDAVARDRQHVRGFVRGHELGLADEEILRRYSRMSAWLICSTSGVFGHMVGNRGYGLWVASTWRTPAAVVGARSFGWRPLCTRRSSRRWRCMPPAATSSTSVAAPMVTRQRGSVSASSILSGCA